MVVPDRVNYVPSPAKLIEREPNRPIGYPELVYTGRDRSVLPLVRSINTLQRGLAVIQGVSQIEMQRNLQDPLHDTVSQGLQATDQNTEYIQVVLQGLQATEQSIAYMKVLGYLGQLASLQSGLLLPVSSVEETTLYIQGLKPSRASAREQDGVSEGRRILPFFQRRRLAAAARLDPNKKYDRQMSLINAGANILTHHLADLTRGYREVPEVIGQKFEVDSPEEIKVRASLFDMVLHDVGNRQTPLKVRFQNLIRMYKKASGDPLMLVEKMQNFIDQAANMGGYWQNLKGVAESMSGILQDPYRKVDMQYAEVGAEVLSTINAQKRFGANFSYRVTTNYLNPERKLTWSPEWIHSVTQNVIQNLDRVWRDVESQNLRPGENKSLHIVFGEENGRFVLKFCDNGTGFSEKALQGGSGYQSHNESTGKALKQFEKMVGRYGGSCRRLNAYMIDGQEVVNGDVNFLREHKADIKGAVVEFVIPFSN